VVDSAKPSVWIFGWPGFVGGADTKLHHLLLLLHAHCHLTVVPNDARLLQMPFWTGLMDRLGVKYALLESLPPRLEGFALALCNESFFTDRIAHRARERGLKIVWSGEMMWPLAGEVEGVREGLVDKVLYVSELQRARLSPEHNRVSWQIAGNYVEPDQFPFVERRNPTFTIGRLSRPAPEKYPEDFPVFYERLELPEVRFRVMAWDEALAHKYRWHRFDRRWELLPSEADSQLGFLHSLDLFVYPLGHRFVESWGRSTVEAMLTGCVPLVPTGHHLENLVVHGETGYVCSDFLEWKEQARNLCLDYGLRRRMAHQCREHAEQKLCNREEHLRTWLSVFSETEGGAQNPQRPRREGEAHETHGTHERPSAGDGSGAPGGGAPEDDSRPPPCGVPAPLVHELRGRGG
jgi:glycosyltransferase involved in cell wall biosynthesis